FMLSPCYKISLLLLICFPPVSPLKFLCYSPRIATSHVNYLGKLADSLVDAGHEVVILSPIVDSKLSSGSNRARVIEIPTAIDQEFEQGSTNDAQANWNSGETWQALSSWAEMFDVWVDQCNSTITYPGLMDRLRDENFDSAFGESMHWCMAGLLHILGIKKFAVTESIAYKDGMYALSQVPTAASYVPSIMGGSFGDEMTFVQRAFNLFNTLMFTRFNYGPVPKHQKMFERNFPGFPDIVKPEHNVTQGIPNLMETTWAPQHDLLHDPRLSAFVTHCGAGSTTEANYAGVPLLVVPVTFDQIRNAFAVKRNGLGLNLDKSDLGRPEVFQNALREVLDNPKYKQQASLTAAMLNDKPLTAREIFVRNMEFLAKHGPLRQLDHHGRHLNIFLYYLIDVTAAVVIALALIASFVVFIIMKLLRCVRGMLSAKWKKE
ncbi:hypothetical protein PENTCL1PPCAC_1087, partial [Pristionchus entomophagus]